MRKILTIASAEFQTAVRSKAFIIGLLFMPLIMTASIALQFFLSQRVDRDERRFVVIDHTDRLYPAIEEAAAEWNETQQVGTATPKGPRFTASRVRLDGRTPDAVKVDLSEQIKRKELFAFVEIPANVLEKPGAAIRYHTNAPTYSTLPRWIDTTISRLIIGERVRAANVDPALVRTLTADTPVDSLGLLERTADGRVEAAQTVNRLRSFLVPLIMLVLMFMVVMSSATPLLNSVLEEKMTRVSEVMLGSVRPFELMMGKLVGSVSISLVLMLVYLSGALLVATRWNLAGLLTPAMAGWFILFLVLEMLMFGAMFIAVGAACTDQKDAQAMMAPMMMVLLFPMFVWSVIVEAPDSTFSVILSMIPFAAPFVMILRLSLQPSPPLIQVIAAAGLTLAASVVCVWAAGKIFRTGILMQGKSATFGEMLRWLRA